MDNAETQPLLGDAPGPKADCEKGVSGHLGGSQPVKGSMATPPGPSPASGKPVGGVEPSTTSFQSEKPPNHREVTQVKEEPQEQDPHDPHPKSFPVSSCPESRTEDDKKFGKDCPKETVEKDVDPGPNPCTKKTRHQRQCLRRMWMIPLQL